MRASRDVVIISSLEWGFLWQGHHEIATRLSAEGHRVLYIENLGIRAPRLTDTKRVLHRLASAFRSFVRGGVNQIGERLWVCSALVLPPFGSRWQSIVNQRIFLRRIRRSAKRLGFTDPVIWTFLPTDTALHLLRQLKSPRSITIYYCIADFDELVPDPQKLAASERALVQEVDLVFTQSKRLATKLRVEHAPSRIMPFGVNLDRFRLRVGERPTRKPVIGYVGGLHRHVATDVLKNMIRQRPEWAWTLVGPEQTPMGDLKGFSNVRLLGHRSHAELPALIADFDVGIVPYVHNDYTQTVVPTKINEYLAVGVPVVATDLPEVIALKAPVSAVITAPPETEAFLRGIEEALRLPTGEDADLRRRQLALSADWAVRLETMWTQIEDLDSRRLHTSHRSRPPAL